MRRKVKSGLASSLAPAYPVKLMQRLATLAGPLHRNVTASRPHVRGECRVESAFMRHTLL